MSRILESRFGLLKHFALGVVFLLGCHLAVAADPGTGFVASLLISLAVSAATTAATYLLTAVLTPKPKAQDKGKLQGEVQLSTTGEDVFINEIYGCRQADGQGGMRVGGVFCYASPIRLQVVTTSGNGGGGNSGGKGGFGGGGGSAPAQNEHKYFQDFAIIFGRGPCRVLEIKVGTDVVYKNNVVPYISPGEGGGTTGSPAGEYEAENAVLAGTAPNADGGFSSGFNVPLNLGDSATFTVPGDGKSHAFYIVYYCIYDGMYLDVSINGTAHKIAVPNTYGRIESVMLTGTTNDGDTTVFIHAPMDQADVVWLDKIVVGGAVTESVIQPVSGIRDPNFLNPEPTYNFKTLRDPLSEDWRGAYEYNYQQNANETGETAASLPAGAEIRIYEGNATQMPDPLLEAHYSQLGLSAPALRHRCYAMFANFETTKYGAATPQVTAVLEHTEIHDLGAMYEHRARRVGVKVDEMNFEALTDVPLRAYAITNRQAPRTEMEILNRIFDVDVAEMSDGKIRGIVPSEEIVATIPLDDLDVEENGGEQTVRKPIEEIIRDDYQIPRRLDVSFFRSEKDWDVGSVQARRTVTISEEVENIESALVLTETEAQKIANRELQKLWAEKDAFGFATFYKHGYLEPTDLIDVETMDGTFQRVRVKAINGNVPGKLKFTCVSRDLPEPAERVFQITHEDETDLPGANVPGHVVGTIIDVAILRTSESEPGFYIAGALTDARYPWGGASVFWEREGGYELLEVIRIEATMGRTVSGVDGILPDVPPGWTEGAWDTSSDVTFDLYNGEIDSKNSDAEVLDRAAALLIGDEIVPFRYAERIGGYPNRWRVSRLQRRVKGTVSDNHGQHERVVLLDDGVKFVPLDISEYGKTRNYKFVSSGQELASASAFQFTWDGRTNRYKAPPPIDDLEWSEVVKIAEDGTVNISIAGEANFGVLDFPQVGKLYIKREGETWMEVQPLVPDINNVAGFVIPNLEVGSYKLKVVVYNDLIAQAAPVVEYPVTLDGKDDAPNEPSSFVLSNDGTRVKGKIAAPPDTDIKGYNIYNADDVFQFFNPSTEFYVSFQPNAFTLKATTVDRSGNESEMVPATFVPPGITVGVLDKTDFALGSVNTMENKAHVEFDIQPDDTAYTSIYLTMDGVRAVRVKALNLFGEQVGAVQAGFAGRGKVVVGWCDRAFADPCEQMVFSLQFLNPGGAWSQSIYWTDENTTYNFWHLTNQKSWNGTTTAPPWQPKTKFPGNLQAQPLNATEVMLTWTNASEMLGNQSIWYRPAQEGRSRTGWIYSGLSYNDGRTQQKVGGLSPNTKYEFMLNNEGYTARYSNTATARTLFQPPPPPAVIAPSSISAIPLSSTIARVSITTDNTDYDYWDLYKDGAYVAGRASTDPLYYDVTGLTPGQTYSFKAWHSKSDGSGGYNFSPFTAEISVTMPIEELPTTNDPTNLQVDALITGDLGFQNVHITLTWERNGGGNALIFVSTNGDGDAGGNWAELASNLGDAEIYSFIAAPAKHYWFKVLNSGGGGFTYSPNWSNHVDIITPWTHHGGGGGDPWYPSY